MYTKKIFPVKELFFWTRYETGLFFVICLIEVGLYVLTDKILNIPFAPIGLIGTAVAFIIGFQSNAAYGRIWEARKIWGAIVNSSRTFGMMTQDFITNEHAKPKLSEEQLQQEIKTITYRHIAWLTALRYAMREPRKWEYVMKEHTNKEWANRIYVPEFKIPFQEAIKDYLSEVELDYISTKSNKQTAILYLQSHHLRKLKESQVIWEFSFLELQNVLEELFTHQGKSERIKNFPYPRQFATLLYYFTWIFVIILPISMAGQFDSMSEQIPAQFDHFNTWFVWLSIPFSTTLMWIFSTMNRIGRVGENPFEGSANDVPISAISRGIENDLRQNLGEAPETIPAPFPTPQDTQM